MSVALGPKLWGFWGKTRSQQKGPVFRRIYHQQTRAIDCLWNGSQERVDALSSIEDTWHIPATKTPTASALQVPALGVHVSNLTRDVCCIAHREAAAFVASLTK